MSIADEIRAKASALRKKYLRPIYLVMNREHYKLLRACASDWMVTKAAYEYEMFYGMYIVIADVHEIQLSCAPWEQVKIGR